VNTDFEEVYHLFLSSIQDYNLKRLFDTEIDIAEDMLYTLLMRSIPKFYNCQKDIKKLDYNNHQFLCELDIEEKNILSELMVSSWLDWVVNDITQMNIHLNDNDFKHFSEESNLKQKSEYSDRVREKVSQDIVNYGLYKTDFSKWAVGDYGV
jgi:hypothetical protein